MKRFISLCLNSFIILPAAFMANADEVSSYDITFPDSDTPIYAQPQGEKHYYDRDAYGFYFDWDSRLFGQRLGGISIIDGEDGFTYIHNPFSGWATESYLKGRKESDGIVVSLPQMIYREQDVENPGKIISFYAVMLEKNGSGSLNYKVSEVDEVVFKITDDGKIILDTGYDPDSQETGNNSTPELLFGMCNQDGTFYVGDGNQILTPSDVAEVYPPENLETEEWSLFDTGDAHTVLIGMDGEDVYLYNFDFIFAPKTWIKGKIDNDYITFPGGQFLCENGGYFYWYVATDFINDQFTVKDNVTFYYDRERMLMIPNEYDCMVSNPQKNFISWSYPEFMYYDSPYMKKVTETPTSYVPQNPIFNYYIDYGGYKFSEFSIYPLSVEYDMLDTSNLYYQIFFNDVIEEVPYSNNNYDFPFGFLGDVPDYMTIQSFGGYVDMYLYIDGLESIGVQLLYKSPEGEEFYSALVTYDILTGEIITEDIENSNVENITSPEIINSEYYDFNGRIIQNPDNGMYILRQYHSDGTVTNKKILKKTR